MPGPTIRILELLQTAAPPELGPSPRAGVWAEAEVDTKLDRYLLSTELSRERQQVIRALVLLWHDHLDAAHRLAQDVPGPDGAFVHGIMHRREPDFANAAYWFRRVGKHPAYAEIASRAVSVIGAAVAGPLNDHLICAGEWDPFAFINACERAYAVAGSVQPLRELQRIESEALLKYLAGG